MQRLDQVHARSKPQLATQEAQLSELKDEVRQLRRQVSPVGPKTKPQRQYPNATQDYSPPPPSYADAFGEKEAQVSEKQAVVAQARERTLEEDVLIATIPAVFAASESFHIFYKNGV